jgi:hypothetical protein
LVIGGEHPITNLPVTYVDLATAATVTVRHPLRRVGRGTARRRRSSLHTRICEAESLAFNASMLLPLANSIGAAGCLGQVPSIAIRYLTK